MVLWQLLPSIAQLQEIKIRAYMHTLLGDGRCPYVVQCQNAVGPCHHSTELSHTTPSQI